MIHEVLPLLPYSTPDELMDPPYGYFLVFERVIVVIIFNHWLPDHGEWAIRLGMTKLKTLNNLPG